MQEENIADYEAEEEQPSVDKPTMYVEIELKCEKCGKIKKVEVPVACEVVAEKGKEELVCDVAGEIELPKCECGGKLKKVVKREKEIQKAYG